MVFGRERKPPSAQAEKLAAKKKADQQQGKFFNKFAPEVIEELDKHQRPMQKAGVLLIRVCIILQCFLNMLNNKIFSILNAGTG